MCNSASYETAMSWESFEHRGTEQNSPPLSSSISLGSKDSVSSKCHLINGWKGFDVTELKFSSTPILLSFVLLTLWKQTIKHYSDVGQRCRCCQVNLLELKLKCSIKKIGDIEEQRLEKL